MWDQRSFLDKREEEMCICGANLTELGSIEMFMFQ